MDKCQPHFEASGGHRGNEHTSWPFGSPFGDAHVPWGFRGTTVFIVLNCTEAGNVRPASQHSLPRLSSYLRNIKSEATEHELKGGAYQDTTASGKGGGTGPHCEG